MDTWDKSKTEAHKPASPSIVCSVSSHMFNFRSPIGQHSHDLFSKGFWDLEFPQVNSKSLHKVLP